MIVSFNPTSLGDLRITSRQAFGIHRAPHVMAPPFSQSAPGNMRPSRGRIFLSDADGALVSDGDGYFLEEAI